MKGKLVLTKLDLREHFLRKALCKHHPVKPDIHNSEEDILT